MEEYYFDDKELGRVVIRRHSRARRYSIRISEGKVWGVMPLHGDMDRMIAFILANRGRIKLSLERHRARQPEGFSEATQLETASFRLRIVRTERENFYMSLRDGVLQVACPQATDFGDAQVQDLLRNMLESALRHEAKRLLPGRLEALARKHGFRYAAVRINSSRGRWGSCSDGRNINLSLWLMLMPWPLSDYVLLHELCHTREMNHSPRFWALMDRVTGGQARALREATRKYKPL